MEYTRRDFLKGSLFAGGSLLLPRASQATTKKEPDWTPSY